MNCPLKQREQRPGVGEAGQEQGANFVQVSSFDEWARSAECPAPCRRRPLSAVGLHGNVCLGLVVPLDSGLFSGLPESESAVRHIFSLMSLTH